ncbi:lactate utilization protein C [Streptomyces sp. AV19]|uniref:LutC/YkgG family protein n=1 Tax=Streptomyces sp. AV19 TaxID=2793068 RepID=UPI0018FE3FCF|nr:lactate utilization protein C [Streptomyces sp. AV19]MBH1934329.1 lactate utilization protein C [Streptomyces sp. AV19]MDG4533363.1 lactate utilization protein C [Streptomyces sp. AV19]
MNARETVLNRIRRATADLPATRTAIPRSYLRHAPTVAPGDREGAVALLVERLEEYGADVRRTDGPGLPAAVARALEPVRSTVVPDGLPEEWLTGWDGEVRRDAPPLPHTELSATEAVVTTCAVAIAESGTLVLDGSPGQGRRAPTLLPDLHVCVVRAEQVVSAMPEAISHLDPRRPLTWISGPSATADIEMIRVRGVHGPRRLTVLIAS